MAIDLNLAAPDEGEEEDGRLPDLNWQPVQEEDEAALGEQAVQEEDGAALGEQAVQEEDGAALHEELQPEHHFDLNMDPEDEHEPDVAHGEEDLHEPDESDDELEDQGGVFQSMEEEVQAMNEALQNLQVDEDDYGVYAGDIDIQFEEEELDDSAPEEDMDVEQEQQDNEQVHDDDKYKNLTGLQRAGIYEELLARSVNRKLKKTTTREVANMFHVSVHKVRRVWRRVKECLRQGVPVDVRSRKPKNCGRKREANKKARLQFCLSMFDQQSLQNRPTFRDMRNIIHIDEKWFNTTQKTMKFYKLPSEQDPHRTVQNKNSIGKIMFLVAIARPRYNVEGICIFDGKIGIWPFIKKEPAPRKSDYRPRGTLITKTISVNREISRQFLIQKVLPAIQAVWPQELAGETIWIQQDNAPSHVPSNDPGFLNAVAQTGLDIRLMQQPSNSPDMNILDLGLFSSLQSMSVRLVSNNLDELINNVQHEYDAYDADKINRIFLTLQSCLIEVMKRGGSNDYKIPHMYKDGLERAGNLPDVLDCDRELYESVTQALAE
ncbi:uncharacterized protein LOC123426911 [Hordeum vulgare subsp. vulgare]|uniref:uncharacterized protein LOC123426911 n=1 Tax=Hordeum vulgare subsp. vulgare TaxID=112509 RepID=UPI001D1A4DE3|nr:uncharacterized protein LOC123426911 [Hordeum vulgare subsp. vulgare]